MVERVDTLERILEGGISLHGSSKPVGRIGSNETLPKTIGVALRMRIAVLQNCPRRFAGGLLRREKTAQSVANVAAGRRMRIDV